jgi:hypothetical protein
MAANHGQTEAKRQSMEWNNGTVENGVLIFKEL